MTSRDDYLDEMPGRPPIDDATAEDLFAGRPVRADLAPLATVVRALRDVACQPAAPSAELAARMAAGTAVAVRPRSAARGRRPRTAWRIVAAGTGAIGRASLVAKLTAAGVVVAVVGVGSAGFAGSLPDPVQDRFETVVESVVPFQFPKRAPDPAPPEPGSTAGGGSATAPERPDAGRPGKHGHQVSNDARANGGTGAGDRAGSAGHRPADPPGDQRRPAAAPGSPRHPAAAAARHR